MEAKHVFQFTVHLDYKHTSIEESVYTNVDIETITDRIRDNLDNKDEWKAMSEVENQLQKIIFTPEKIEELKQQICKKIWETPNPFNISCTDWDGGYNVEETDLLENKIEFNEQSFKI